MRGLMIPAWVEGLGGNKNVVEIRRTVGRVCQNSQKNLASVQTTKPQHHARSQRKLAAASSANVATKLLRLVQIFRSSCRCGTYKHLISSVSAKSPQILPFWCPSSLPQDSRLAQAEVPAALIASMSPSCGAGGRADDVSQFSLSFFGGEPPGGVTYWLLTPLSWAAEASACMSKAFLCSLCDVSTLMFCSCL